MINTLYYFIEKCEGLSVLEISLKYYERRIWIILKNAEKQNNVKREKTIRNLEMEVVRAYFKTKNIFLKEEKLPDKVEIGFETVN